jgi:uncharacterized protein YjbI with pentapeptide repeats
MEMHRKWLDGNGGGKLVDLGGANLRDADLSNANLGGADLRDADLSGANLSGANLGGANLRDADLRYANSSHADLSNADLDGANLGGADLRDADLDFSSGVPLHRGGLCIKLNERIMRQLAYHFCSMECDSPEAVAAQNALMEFANGSHVIVAHSYPKLLAKG